MGDRPRAKFVAKALEKGLEFFEECGEPGSLKEFERAVQKFAEGSERFGRLKIRVEKEEEEEADPFEWPATESSVWIETGSVATDGKFVTREVSPKEVASSSGVERDSLADIFSQPITGSAVSVQRPTPEAKAKATPPTRRETTEQTSAASAATCDFRVNRVHTAAKSWYLILRSPNVDGAPEPGLYYGTWTQLCAIALPEKKLPQTGYGYRKAASQTDPSISAAWQDQGHRRSIPVFHL